MKKHIYSILLGVLLLVCMIIPAHTTVKAANTTDDCLQILTSDFDSNSVKKFIGTQHLNITDSQYQTIREFTLDLTSKYTSTKDKITAIYQWAKDTSQKASVGEDAPADLGDNDPYKVFKEKTGVCQGKANLCKTMLAAIDVPCIIAHGYWETEGHAWDFVLCDGTWGIVDASMWQISLDDPSNISSHYKTDSLEAVLYEKDGFEFTYYLGGIGVVGYTGNADRLEIPASCNGHSVVSIAAENQIYYEHPFQNTIAKELVLPATLQYGIYLSDYEIRSFSSQSLESIVVDENNPVFASYDGILYSKDFSRIYSVPAGISEVTLKPMEVMEKNTLVNLPNLRILKISEGTNTLEEDAVESCPNLEKVYIPDSVTAIASEENNGYVYEAFTKCPDNFVVYASAGSAGEAYAKKKGLTCKDPKELFPADYSKIDALLKTVPQDLSIYTSDSVNRLNQAIDSIDRSYTAAQQDLVDAMANTLESAINNLELRPADYSKIDLLLKNVPQDLSIYTSDSVNRLNQAINSIDRSYTVTQQALVDAMANTLESAINNLGLRPADYSKIDLLLKNVPQDLSIYTSDSVNRLNQAINSIDRSYTVTQQALVDAMANTLESAIRKLEVRPAIPDSNETEKPQPETKPATPAKVTGVKIAYKKSGKVILSWKRVKNASGYEIYRYQNKKWVKVKKSGKKTNFVIKKRSKKTVYYRVRAFRKKGKNVSYGKYSKKIKCKAVK